MTDLKKRFSLAHPDSWSSPSLYYEALKNSSQQFKDEIYDIYFGKIFRYDYRGQEAYDNEIKLHQIAYGNVMGVEASDEEVDYLIKIQKEYGIDISLTINQLNIPVEIFYSRDDRVLGAFLDWLQDYYDRGLRCCTLANNHMMRAGFLQKRFPEMRWKNTVNQQVSNAQQVIDYIHLGYNIIQLDRSLNRNMDELKRIKEVIENYKNKNPEKYIKTCMLVWESCMPSCPYKRVHDDLQIYHKKINYYDSPLGEVSCMRWKNIFSKPIIPRLGNDCFWSSVDTFKEYAELVDIFKYSGRLTSIPQSFSNLQPGWIIGGCAAVRSFSEIIENRLEPVYQWIPKIGIDPSWFDIDMEKIRKDLQDNIWTTGEGRRLEQRVKNCKNQCYSCHLCEKVFNIPEFDSLIEL